MSVERALEGALEKVTMTMTTTTRSGPTPTTTTVPTVSVQVQMSTARALECECSNTSWVKKACSQYKVLTEFHIDALPHLMGKLGVLVDTSRVGGNQGCSRTRRDGRAASASTRFYHVGVCHVGPIGASRPSRESGLCRFCRASFEWRRGYAERPHASVSLKPLTN